MVTTGSKRPSSSTAADLPSRRTRSRTSESGTPLPVAAFNLAARLRTATGNSRAARKVSTPARGSAVSKLVSALRDDNDLKSLYSSMSLEQRTLFADMFCQDHEGLPSFSKVSERAATAFACHPTSPNDPWSGWAVLEVETPRLPSPVAERLELFWRHALISTGSPSSHRTEAARNLYLQVIPTMVCGIFGGLLVNRSDDILQGNSISSGGRVEHQLAIGNLRIFIAELKLHLSTDKSLRQGKAQAMAELISAAERNREQNITPPVYAILTDASDRFYCLEFDPGAKRFSVSKGVRLLASDLKINDPFPASFETFFSQVFAICLRGVIGAMNSFRTIAAERKDKDGISSFHGPPTLAVPPPMGKRDDRERRSEAGWNEACTLFRCARFYLGHSYFHSADLGFHFLQLALQAIPSNAPIQTIQWEAITPGPRPVIPNPEVNLIWNLEPPEALPGWVIISTKEKYPLWLRPVTAITAPNRRQESPQPQVAVARRDEIDALLKPVALTVLSETLINAGCYNASLFRALAPLPERRLEDYIRALRYDGKPLSLTQITLLTHAFSICI
ncbi:hypothetical protein C8R44DRAFT_853621 [Mycena epipterygia]|nr:hypothetical protein C8R44DRAFT_853621 [Mycena epipterygia]